MAQQRKYNLRQHLGTTRNKFHPQPRTGLSNRLQLRAILTLWSIGLILAVVIGVGWESNIVLGAPLLEDQPDSSTIISPQTINGTWGPGIITATQDIVINPGVVINIAPGTTILVADSDAANAGTDTTRIEFIVQNGATLNVNGPVTFTSKATSPAPADWYGIVFQSGSRGTIKDTLIEYGVHALTLSTDEAITVRNSHIRYNLHETSGGTMAYGAGIYITAGDHIIENSYIYENAATATGTGEVRGGGIYISDGAPKILNSYVYNNTATGQRVGAGGGIAILHGETLIQGTYVTTNTLTGGGSGLKSGGGIGFVSTSNTSIIQSWIAGNRNTITGGYAGGGGIAFDGNATADIIWGSVIYNNYAYTPGHCEGGGIDTWDSNDAVAIINNLLLDNELGACATNAIGGGMNMNGSNTRVVNNTIIGNTSKRGGGLYLQNSSPKAYNNIIAYNTATDRGGGIYRESGTPDYNDLFSNTSPNGADTYGSVGSHNLFVDPMFAGTGGLASYYHLSPCSPLIDAGTDSVGDLPNADYDGDPRPRGDSWDIGFDEIGGDVGAYICKIGSPTTAVAPGESVTFTLIFGNAGTTPASQVMITDVIPSGMYNLSYTNSGAAITQSPGSTYVWTVDSGLAPEETGTITITGDVGLELFGGSVHNMAEIQSTQGGNIAGAAIEVCDTIQCMIDHADPGDTVIVPAGVYTESLTLSKPVSVTGVSSDTVIVRAPTNERAMLVDNASVTNDVVIGGMTFTGGGLVDNGGALYLSNDAQPRLENMRFTDNQVRYRGGAIYLDTNNATLTIRNSEFTNNETQYNNDNSRGGGIYAYGQGNTLEIFNSVFRDNVAEYYGGAIAMYTSSGTGYLVVENNEIVNNEATDVHGGGIYAYQTEVTITDSVLSHNRADSNGRVGGAIYAGGTGSSLTLLNSAVFSNTANSQGGGIYATNNAGVYLIANSVITGNSVTRDDSNTRGGGLYISGNSAQITIRDSGIVHNVAERYGGGIYVYGDYSAQMTITNTTIAHNNVNDNDGGGIYIRRADTEIKDSTIANNAARYDGGGLYLENTSANLINTTVHNNITNRDGGGIYSSGQLTLDKTTLSGNSATDDGGALFKNGNNLTIVNSTFSGNNTTADPDGDGGGLYNYGATTNIYNTTIYDNHSNDDGGGLYRYSGNIYISNSLIAGNEAGDAGSNCNGSIAGGQNNLTNDTSCTGSGFTNDAGAVLLGALADNGGDTLTHMLLTGNPAINAGDNTICNNAPVNGIDQRGFARPQGASCDIGAVEAEAILDITISSTNQDGDPLRPAETLTYTIVLDNQGALTHTNATISATFPANTQYVPGSLQVTPPAAGGSAGTQPILVENLTIAPDSQVSIEYVVTVDWPLAHGTVINNAASANSTEMPLAARDSTSDTVSAIPAMSVTKDGPAAADVAETATYTFTLTNLGDVPLTIQQVEDDIAGTATLATGDTDGDNWLDLTEVWVYTVDYTIQPTDPDPLINTVVITAVDSFSTQINATSNHSTAIAYHPILTITKEGPGTAAVGETIIYTITVQHAASSDGSPVDTLAVNDDIAGSATLNPAGDINGNGTLDAGEIWVYTVDYTIPQTAPDPLENTATVTGYDPDGDSVTANSAVHSLDVVYAPALSAQKSGPSSAAVGETVTFNILVSNDTATGDGSPIYNVTVVDDVAGPATRIVGDATLDADETWVYRVDYTVQPTDTTPLTNTVMVTAEDGDGDTLQATDSHITNLYNFNPELTLQKEGPTAADVGETVIYTFTVEHDISSDGSPVFGSSINDTIAGTASYVSGDDNENGSVDITESWVYTVSYTVQPMDNDPLINQGTVTAKDAEGETISANSNMHVLNVGYNPLLEIVKLGPDEANIGDTISYKFRIYHSAGSDGSPVSDIAVSDSAFGAAALTAGDDDMDGRLSATEIWTYTVSHVISLADPNPLVNTGTLAGKDPEDDPVLATSNMHTTTIGYAPVADDGNYTVDEDSVLTGTLSASDPDGGGIVAYGITQGPNNGNLTVDAGTGEFIYTPTQDFNGTDSFMFIVTDTINLTDQGEVTIIVDPVNDPPLFSSTPNTGATEDQPYSYSARVTDVDAAESLTLTLLTPLDWLILTPSGRGRATLSGVPGNEDVGSHLIELQVEDSAGTIDTQVFTLTVQNTNDAPTFTSFPALAATEEQTYTYTIEAVDIDPGDALSITATTIPGWLILSDNGDGTAILTGMPDNDAVGQHDVELVVTDLAGANDIQRFSISVNNVNDLPVFTSTPITNAVAEVVYQYNVTAEDIDTGDLLTFKAVTVPSWLVLTDNGDGTATLIGMPALQYVGAHAIVLQVNDGHSSALQSFTLTVHREGANTAPIFTGTPATTVTVGYPYSYTVTTFDPNTQDKITLSAPTLPAWLTFHDQGGGTAILSGTPALQHAGQHIVVLQVTDGYSSTQQSFTITVLEETFNTAPIFTSTPVEIGTVDEAYTYIITTFDPDTTDIVTISAITSPDWLTLTDYGSGVAMLGGTPAPQHIGEHNVLLQVTDSYSTTEQAFIITVYENTSNNAPVFTSTPVETATVSRPYTYTITAVDPDGDNLTLSAIVLPTWLTFVDQENGTALLSGTPAVADINDHLVILEATDGQKKAEQTFVITVQAAPQEKPVYSLYLPMVARDQSTHPGPDLIVTELLAVTDSVQLTIKNQGTHPVVDEFWVQVYIDPDPVPTQVNDIWYYLGEEGMFWGVTSDLLPIEPGESITLAYNDSHYDLSHSSFSAALVPGTPVYAQVDAYSDLTTYGAIRESHEIYGDAYNNILGPVYVTPGTLPTISYTGDRNPVMWGNLPLLPAILRSWDISEGQRN